MADFNPQLQPTDINYQTYQPNKAPSLLANDSTGQFLKTIGTGIEEGVSLADTTIKGIIKKQLGDEINSKKENFINTLDQKLGNTDSVASSGMTRNPLGNQYTGDPMDSYNQASDQDLMATKAPVPQGVQKAVQTVQNIQAAKQQSGKFRTTDLDASLVSTLKQARSDYPGYRDYIDEQGKRIVGYDPANKLISDKIAQLNEQRSNAARQQEYWEKKIVDSGYDGSQQKLEEFKRTGDVNSVEKWYAKNTEADAKVTREIKGYQLSAARTANDKATATSALNAAADHAASVYWMNKNENDDASSVEIQKKLYDASQHPEFYTDEAVGRLATQYYGLYQRNVTQTTALMKSLVNKDGKNVYDTLGPAEFNKVIEDTVGSHYQAQVKLLTDKDMGLLSATNRAVGARASDITWNMLNDPSLKAVMGTAIALNKAGGSQMFSPDVLSTIYGTAGNLGPQFLEVAGHQKRTAIAQPNPNEPYTFSDSQAEIARGKSIAGVTPVDEAGFYKDLLSLHKAITEKNPFVADNAIKYFYDPKNRGSLNKLMDDYYDPAKGYFVQGRTTAFSDLTSQDVTKSVWKRSKEGNSTAWDNYKGWAINEAGSNLTNIAKTWNDNIEMNQNNVHNRLLSPGRILGFDSSMGTAPLTNFHFYYDNENHQLGLLTNKGEVIPERNMDAVSMEKLRNTNKYLQAMTRIAHEEGSDPNALIFQTLRQAWPADPQGQKIFKAIAQSYLPPKPEEKKEK